MKKLEYDWIRRIITTPVSAIVVRLIRTYAYFIGYASFWTCVR